MSGARAKAGEVQEKLLTEISGKMTMLLTKFDTMTCGIHEFLNTVKNQTELIKTLAEKKIVSKKKNLVGRRIFAYSQFSKKSVQRLQRRSQKLSANQKS